MRRALLLVVAACYAPTAPQGSPCGPDGECPTGQSCHDGVCTRGPASAIDASRDPDDAPAIDTMTMLDAASDAMVDAMVDAPAIPTCPSTYTAISGQTSLYRTVTTQRAWLAAELDCEDDGSGTHLAVIESAAEHAAVDALTGASIWFGLNDRKTENTELWVTNSAPVYMHAIGTVDNTSNYDCAGIYQSAWVWGDCTTAIEYVCECDGAAAAPASYTP